MPIHGKRYSHWSAVSFKDSVSPRIKPFPEDYNFEEVTERLDMYSTAHVLYGIVAGEKVWEELWGTKNKKLVKEGSKPLIDKQYLTLGTSDTSLAKLIDLAYQLDPQDRIQASKLVDKLKRIVTVEEAKQIGNQ